MINTRALNVVIPVPGEVCEAAIGDIPFSLEGLTNIAEQYLIIGKFESGDSIKSWQSTLEGLKLMQFSLEFGLFKTRSYRDRQNPYELSLAIRKTKQYNAFKELLVQGIGMTPIKDVELLIATEIPFSFDEAMELVSHVKSKRIRSFVVTRLLLTDQASGSIAMDLPLIQESLPLFPIL
jgi:hypothetical protein